MKQKEFPKSVEGNLIVHSLPLARTSVAGFDIAAGILFWQKIKNAKVINILNPHVSLVGFQKFFLCWAAWVILKA